MAGPTLDDLRAAHAALGKRFLRRFKGAPLVATFDLRRAKAMARAQVHAVGIGRKEVDGKRTSVRCVRIHVLQKLAPSAVRKEHWIPAEIDGIPTDVVVTPHAYLLAATCGKPSEVLRPLRPGVGIGGPSTTGTLGCFVRDRADGRIMLLSCSHVLATPTAKRGDAVYQPSRGDGGGATARVADLERFTRVLGRTQVAVDGAVAALRANVGFDPIVCSLVQPQGTRAPEETLSVRKRGRSSTATAPIQEGFVSDRDLDINVAVPGGGVIRYTAQFKIEPLDGSARFSVSGDSGSLVLERNGPRAVGLLVAGDPGGSFSVATPIRRVLDGLGVDLF